MSDPEIMKLAIRRVLDHIKIQPYETPIEFVLAITGPE
jgi:hypothetical protein